MASMTARVFIHPRCTSGPVFGAVIAMFEERGYDASELCMIPHSPKKYELMRRMPQLPGDTQVFYKRMDGELFYPPQPTAPEAA